MARNDIHPKPFKISVTEEALDMARAAHRREGESGLRRFAAGLLTQIVPHFAAWLMDERGEVIEMDERTGDKPRGELPDVDPPDISATIGEAFDEIGRRSRRADD